jgi:hypothetical protein
MRVNPHRDTQTVRRGHTFESLGVDVRATQLFITVTLKALGIGRDAMTAPPQATAGVGVGR